MLTCRLIPCLDVKDGRVVKGVNFENLRDAGDPVVQAGFYAQAGADELTFLDIAATRENRDTLLSLVQKTADKVFIPLTVGGGVKSIENIRALFRAGADKVSINSAAVENPSLVSEAAQIFGGQSIIGSIDAKSVKQGQWHIFTHGGSRATGIDALEWAHELVKRGAGELLVTSMDRDGTKQGYDLELLQAINKIVTVPVIASGGAGNSDDIIKAVTIGKADAVLAASIFHFGLSQLSDIRNDMKKAGIAVRHIE